MNGIKQIIILITLLFISSCSPGITGTVIDAETGKPIEGAVVFVEWTRVVGLPGLTHTESIKVIETVTDGKGIFKVSGNFQKTSIVPHLTIYKRGYVAWNNEYIFPDYKHRNDFSWIPHCKIYLEHINDGYSYDEHVSFINTVINSTIAYEGKKNMREAFDWELELARQEVKKKRTNRR